MKHISIERKENCSGCTACASVCPKQCISMQPDDEGFLYPQVSEETCIECGLCLKTCPLLKDQYDRPAQVLKMPKVYAVKHKKTEVRMHSTSGGVFTALSDYVLQEGGVVCGAAFDEESQSVHHIIVEDRKGRNKIRGSKYVQSNIDGIFPQLKIILQKGRKVLFTGTPCQTAGLVAFLKRDYPNLFLADILCHSVPSPMFFHKAISRGHASNVCFRNKQRGWRNSYEFSIDTDGGKVINTTYLTLFFKGLINRPSCSECHFTNLQRTSDITIGDYWNIQKIDKTFEDDLGVSCVLANTAKGLTLIKSISSELKAIETEVSPAIQDCLSRPVGKTKTRDIFWIDYKHFGYEYCVKKYGHYSMVDKLVTNILVPIVHTLHLRSFVRKVRNLI